MASHPMDWWLLTALLFVCIPRGTSITPKNNNPPSIAFNTNNWPSDTTGPLLGTVLFAQNQIIPAVPRVPNDVQPHLTGSRPTLVMFKPQPGLVDDSVDLTLNVLAQNSTTLVSLPMTHPNDLPGNPKFVPNLNLTAASFPSSLLNSNTISSNTQLQLLNDPSASFLNSRLLTYLNVTIKLADGAWTSDIYLPTNGNTRYFVLITSSASYTATIHYQNAMKLGDAIVISAGTKVTFRYQGGWIGSTDLNHSSYGYGSGFWSAKLSPQFLVPGIQLQFAQGNLTGLLSGVVVGAPTELLLHTIDVGMLVPPRGWFPFQADPTAHREYFQTIPASRMVVSQYQPVYLREVMMPDGRLLTSFDPSVGGWQAGDMREYIGKILISIGIDNANYGIWSSSGATENDNPYFVAQLTAHNSRGNYSNGIQVHGGSGGAGMVTLDSSLGNEFSHEVGHNYGLGHYNGGPNGSLHRLPSDVDSTWGWDSDLNLLVPNFSPLSTGQSTCCCPGGANLCVAPWLGYPFGLDSMAGGSPQWYNRFTLYTPYVVKAIQSNLESKAVFAKASPTGFYIWSSQQKQMVPYQNSVVQASVAVAQPSLLSWQVNSQWVADPNYIQSLFNQGADVVQVAMADGFWSYLAQAPAPGASNLNLVLDVNHKASYSMKLLINGGSRVFTTGQRQSYRSNGTYWVPLSSFSTSVTKTPAFFGVPVTTILGYYDPQGKLTSYIYDALYGAYGFVYSDDSATIAPENCQLQVTTSSGTRVFYLSRVRRDVGYMNKFHVNILTADKALSATVQCNGTALATRTFTMQAKNVTYTVQGLAL